MALKYLMSLDLGGSGGRALVYNTETSDIAFTTCTWSFQPDQEAGGFAFDLGCEAKWQALCEIGRQAVLKAGAQPHEVVGISVTSMRHGMVLIGKTGQVLAAAPNSDARAFSEGMDLQGERGQELYRRTGHIPNPVLLAPRLLWVKKNHPEYLDPGSVVLTISDWMAYMLCGVAASEPTQAGETCLFDLQRGEWAEDIIRSLDLPLHIFPRIVQPGTQLGNLTETAANALGIHPGIPVAAGGADTQLGMLGLGITQANEIGIIAGSTTPVMVTTNRVSIDPEGHTWTGMYPLPGIYVIESNAGNMGASLEWFAKLVYNGSPAPVAALVGDASNSITGATGILSTLGAQLFNASALGLPVDGLTFSTMTTPSGLDGRKHLSRAVLEGMAYSARQNAEQALKVAGVQPHRVHLGGGMTRSQLWTQIISDTFNQPAEVGYGKSASSFGAILCAAVGAGMYPDLVSAVSALVKPARSLSPGAQADAYAELYRVWIGHNVERTAADEIAAGGLMSVMQAGMEGEKPAELTFKPRIYVSANAGEEAIQLLRELGEVTYASYAEAGNVLSGEELADTLRGYQVLVTEVDLVDAGALQNAQDLRVVVACRGNPVNVDIPACTAAGIPVINTPGRNADAVADLAVGFMIMLLRKLDKAAAFLHEPGSEAGDMGRMGQAYFTLKGHELWRKTVGVIGGGAIGQKVIQRLLPFEARLLVFDPFVTAEQAALYGATKVTFEELLAQSDIITLHAPVNDETTGMINASALEQMKPGVYLINTARAALIDHDALLSALQAGKLGGAAFDVFPVEPPGSDDALLTFENVIATPHIGGNTSEVGIHQGYIIVDELKRLLAGQKPKFALNPQTLEGFSWGGEQQINRSKLAELAQGPGPGMTDLDVKAKKQETAIPAEVEKLKSGGLLGGLRRLVGGKSKDDLVPQPAPALQGSDVARTRQEASYAARTRQEASYAAILEQFLLDLCVDPNAQGFSKTNKVSFQFVLKYTAISFYMGFGDGKVTAGMGDAPFKPDVTVKVDADTFDGMFTGRIDGNQAFKSGKLSVSGNMLKAMAIQKLNFGPVYAKARDAAGGSGDLTLLGPVAAVVPTAPQPASSPAEAGTSGGSTGPDFTKFTRIIEHFVTQMRTDPDTLAFAKGKNVTFQYIIKDAGVHFYTGFVNGNVNTGMGDSPEKADVTIKTDAATLDGMFTGKLDGTAAFKSGKLSVGGNMMKAMVMQKLNYGALYNQARAVIGDPGDLSGTAQAAPVQPAATAAGAASAPPIAVPAVIHKVGDIRDVLLEVNNEMFQHGWITSTGGNISVRSDHNPEEIWITPSGLFKGSLRADMMVKIDLDGNLIGDAPYNASSERKVHCAIFRCRPEMKAVVHTHAKNATLMALTGTKWLPISADAAFFGEIPVVPFIMPGSPELGDAVADALGMKGVAAIMQNHGLVVAGSDLRRAADTTEAIELTAEKLLWCKKMGIQPAVLPDDIVSILSEMGSMVA